VAVPQGVAAGDGVPVIVTNRRTDERGCPVGEVVSPDVRHYRSIPRFVMRARRYVLTRITLASFVCSSSAANDSASSDYKIGGHDN
jgi:hypothetical protein